MLVPEVRVVCCAPKTHACPHCGKRGCRVRRLHRKVRSLAYRREAWIDVRYAEYKARCRCCKTFRSWPLDVPAKADYDGLVRAAVLERVLQDGLNVQRTIACMWRDFSLRLSEGFVYDCIRWKVAQLDLPAHRHMVIQRFSGTLCIDELHLGRFTLLLATDPIPDLPVAFALVSKNDKAHMRRFLSNLKSWGLLPAVVVTDGSNLYPDLLARLWPAARHQLCVFHILKDINALILKHRFLLVKKTGDLTKEQWQALAQVFEYESGLRTLWYFARDVHRLFEKEARVQALFKRRAALLRDERYKAVAELAEAMAMLEEGKFKK